MNIHDYIDWRGDIPFSVDPLNEADYLVFADLVYCRFDGLLNKNKVLTIKELSEAYFANEINRQMLDNSDVSFEDPVLLNKLSKSKRYMNLNVHDYVSSFHDANNEQFAAMMIDVPNFETIVAFRGTDDSLAGWVEDFEISCKEIKSQKDAVEYMNNRSKIFRKYILLGHSKGGNLAIYSAMNVKDKIEKRIKKIISIDGPGLVRDTYSKEKFDLIKNKYIKYSPSYSIVGSIFDNEEEKIIVKSNSTGFGQHDLLTWQIEGNRILKSDKIENDSILFTTAVDSFVSKTTVEERQIFIDELSNALRKADVDAISDIYNGDLKKFALIINNISSTSKKAKDITNLFFMEFVNVFGNNFVDTVKGFVEGAANSIKNLHKKTSD